MSNTLQTAAIVGAFHYNPSRLHPRLVRRLREIASYFDESTITSMLVPVASASFDVSLRLLDYCCTNYAKKTRVVICEDGRAIHLFSLYKDWLRHYRRRCFDPFRRRERIRFANPSNATEWLDTTVAQLNFLRWADIYKVIPYVRRNMHKIEQDMIFTLSESKKRRVQKSAPGAPLARDETSMYCKRKRTELSKAPRNKCTVYLVPANLAFHD
uniref:Uncharacterized protein n=1 Tax=viral metagenome TaxID=1070528 RepID=A0A6C0C057_9ZZZZ